MKVNMVQKKQNEMSCLKKKIIESSILNGPTIEFEYQLWKCGTWYQSIIQYLKHSDWQPVMILAIFLLLCGLQSFSIPVWLMLVISAYG